MNPLLPAWYDIVWTFGYVVVILSAVVALISLARRSKQLSGSQALGWTFLVIFVPVIGAAAWFAIGARANRSAPANSAQSTR